jgi:hypothetical protein
MAKGSCGRRAAVAEGARLALNRGRPPDPAPKRPLLNGNFGFYMGGVHFMPFANEMLSLLEFVAHFCSFRCGRIAHHQRHCCHRRPEITSYTVLVHKWLDFCNQGTNYWGWAGGSDLVSWPVIWAIQKGQFLQMLVPLALMACLKH